MDPTVNGPANPPLPPYRGDVDRWDGYPVRAVGPAVYPKWAYLVRISPGRPGDPIVEIDYDSSPTYLAELARNAIDRLRRFRGHEVAEDDDFHEAISWFEDVAESGSLDDLNEALDRLYDWGDRRRVCIS